MIRYVRMCLAVLLSLWLATPGAHAGQEQPNQVNIHVFWSQGCSHCKRALRFLDRFEADQPGIQVVRHEVSGSRENLALFLETAKRFGIDDPGVPLVVIGPHAFLGYNDDATTGQEWKAAALQCLQAGCADAFAAERPQTASPLEAAPQLTPGKALQSIRLPLFGEIEFHQLSLPLLTVVLATADGFNPCAMWVLIFLLGLLVGVENRLRRFILGGAFILTTAVVYYLIMEAWLNTLLFLGMVKWIRIAIGVVALAVGVWSLREFFVNPDSTCKVTGAPARRAVLERLRSFALSPSLILALVGIVLLAFAVNVVELLCSAGIPATFAQVLALNDLPYWQYHAYIGLYVLVFMLDDLLIFTGAMLAMEITGLGAKYSRWANLFGGIVLTALGILIIAKPEWLA